MARDDVGELLQLVATISTFASLLVRIQARRLVNRRRGRERGRRRPLLPFISQPQLQAAVMTQQTAAHSAA